MLEDGYDEESQHGSDHERAAVAEVHLRLLSDDVEHEERNECAGCDHSHSREIHIGCLEEECSQDYRYDYRVAGHEAVDSVDHVDRIDDADTCEDGQRYSYVAWDFIYSPEAVEVVDRPACSVYEEKHDDDLDRKPEVWGKRQDVVCSTDKEHDGHDSKEGEEAGASEEDLAEDKRYNDSEEDRETSKYGYRMILKLSSVRIVYDILYLSDPMYLPEYPQRSQQGDTEKNEYVNKTVHILIHVYIISKYPAFSSGTYVDATASIPGSSTIMRRDFLMRTTVPSTPANDPDTMRTFCPSRSF